MTSAPGLPASRGFTWIVQSWFLLRLQAGRLLLIALLMQLLVGLTQLPLLSFLVILAVPGLNAGILEAFHLSGQGLRPPVSTLFRPLATAGASGRLFALGALVFLVAVVVIALVLPGGDTAPDPEVLNRLQQGDIDAMAELDPGLLQGILLAFLIGIAASGTLSFFTIPLIWFKQRKLAPAVLEGLRGLIKNWKPVLVLGVGLALASLPFGLATVLLYSFTGSSEPVSFLVKGLMMLVFLLYQVLIFGTQYCAAKDVFGFTAAPSPEDPKGDDSQLVA